MVVIEELNRNKQSEDIGGFLRALVFLSCPTKPGDVKHAWYEANYHGCPQTS
jgi:hypothetical protein